MTTEDSVTQEPIDIDAALARLILLRQQLQLPRPITREIRYAHEYRRKAESLLRELSETVALLASSAEAEASGEAVVCPACRQLVAPNADGTLPGHEISAGPKRSPICRFRGVPGDVMHSLSSPDIRPVVTL